MFPFQEILAWCIGTITLALAGWYLVDRRLRGAADAVLLTAAGSGAEAGADAGTELLIPGSVSAGGRISSANSGFLVPHLRPAELAYLNRNGDFTHALLVLGADILQRTVKAQISEAPMPLPAAYEEKVFSLARDQAKQWMLKKADDVVPRDFTRDPVRYVRRISIIYTFLAKNLRTFIIKTIEDPRQIRKYFSYAGIVRLVTSIFTAGYRESLEHEIRTDLHARGLLIRTEARVQASNILGGLGLFTLVLGGFIAFRFVQPLGAAFLLFLGCVLTAALLEAFRFVLELIPLYTEMAAVAWQIDRPSFRLNVLRALVSLIAVLANVWSVVLGLLSAGFWGGLLMWVFKLDAWVFLCFASLLAVAVCAVRLLGTAYRLRVEEIPTSKGLVAVRAARSRLSKLRPVSVFADMLRSPDYDQTFSELLAIYGIETLLLLG